MRRFQSGILTQLTGVYAEYEKQLDDLNWKLNHKNRQYDDLQRKFDAYKKENNLDAYFSKNLNEATRRRTLALVKELLEPDPVDDAKDRLHFDALHYSGCKLKLGDLEV